ncbi:MAG TPA: glycosyltransferase family 4 protein [Vicinamibacterales bacterium]|jgi:glycosyltransferase involved in cell wall biosynthesis|nr:glycosyltransferase family 4 protein [Vicinamibacterales bacterium]
MRVLHAIHDFLPRHRAGSEIYAFELAQELSRRADVFVLAAEYDPSVPHGTIRWRSHEGLVVVEIVNNWEFRNFHETYKSDRMNAQLRHVLDATCPDVLHVHNLLNLSFDLPWIAKQRGIASVATLHDYTLVCPSGGQRVHVAESHVCHSIDADRCARCFGQSFLSRQMRAAKMTRGFAGGLAGRAGRAIFRMAPVLATSMLNMTEAAEVSSADVRRRLGYARQVFESIDLFVAPSRSMAEEFCRLGLSADRVEVSDYGFPPSRQRATEATSAEARPLRIGFVGTLVWHKGVHVLVEAARKLRGKYELHIHGDTAIFPDYAATLRKSAAGLPVVFQDGFDRERVSDVYNNLDVLVVPSLWPENSPLVIHEAFMHHVAVVGARVGGIPELVTEEINGFLYDPFDSDSLAASLQRLIDDRELVETLARRVPAVKSIEQDAREWEQRYRRVLQPAEVHACT